jgi:hypothetical protein
VAVVLVAAAGVEGAWRAFRAASRGALGRRLEQLVQIAVAVAAAGGLGLFVGGARPAESLHFVYAVVALGATPVAASLSRRWQPRTQGATSAVAAAVVLVVILRLFQTG